jgi:hypothetical protein
MSWRIWRAPHVALLLASAAGSSVAQEPLRGRVIDTRYRWLPHRARAEAVPYSTRSASFRIDSVASLADGVRYVMREGAYLTTLEIARDRRLRVDTQQRAATTVTGQRREPGSFRTAARSKHRRASSRG